MCSVKDAGGAKTSTWSPHPLSPIRETRHQLQPLVEPQPSQT